MKLSNYLNKKTLKETYLRFSLINKSLLKKIKQIRFLYCEHIRVV